MKVQAINNRGKYNYQQNQNTNFKAKLKLEGLYNQSSRWQTIAKDFETKTAKKFPEYGVKLQEMSKNKMTIFLDQKPQDEVYLHIHTLSEEATSKLINLPNNEVINKLMILLNMCKRRDKLVNELPNDIAKLEKKYNIKFDQKSLIDSCEDSVCVDNYIDISTDDILSDYTATSNTFMW